MKVLVLKVTKALSDKFSMSSIAITLRIGVGVAVATAFPEFSLQSILISRVIGTAETDGNS